MSHFEDRRLGVGIDGDNAIGPFHAFEMFRCPRNADSDIKLRFDRLPRFSDLPHLRKPPGVDDRPAAGDFRIKRCREIVRDRDLIDGADTASDTNDPLALGEIDLIGIGSGCADEADAQRRQRLWRALRASMV